MWNVVLVQQLWTFLSDKLVNAPQAGEMRVYQLVALDSILLISSAVEGDGDGASKQVAADPPSCVVVADHVPDAISTVQISRLPTNQMAINSSLGTHTYRQTTAQSLPRVALDGLIRAMIQRRTDPPFAPLNLSPPSISHFAPPPPQVSSAIFQSLYRSYSAFFVCFSGIGPPISVNSLWLKVFFLLVETLRRHPQNLGFHRYEFNVFSLNSRLGLVFVCAS
ncbi:hypothetical protein VitviT2T_029996 [Vitis vinifera]|uniref:Uncharacterized protein n=1 Tax=Vitis vinifera TaxID=29760 RepID=A0ABY9E1F6_VITVI|nr:hypothetical protein VitviT2T_029996 [Vitis vinifera]